MQACLLVSVSFFLFFIHWELHGVDGPSIGHS